MKKILLLSAVCLPVLAAPAFADDHYNYGSGSSSTSSTSSSRYGAAYDANDNHFTGPYLGATIDYSWTGGDGSTTTAGVTTEDDFDVDGVQGGILAGYGFQFDPGFLNAIWSGYTAFEVGYEWNAGDDDFINGFGVEKDDVLNISVRPGFAWSNKVLGYGIIGYSRANFQAGADDEWLNGWSVGAGTELATFGAVRTRIEYVYTNYEDASLAASGATTANINPHENAIKLGAIVRF